MAGTNPQFVFVAAGGSLDANGYVATNSAGSDFTVVPNPFLTQTPQVVPQILSTNTGGLASYTNSTGIDGDTLVVDTAQPSGYAFHSAKNVGLFGVTYINTYAGSTYNVPTQTPSAALTSTGTYTYTVQSIISSAAVGAIIGVAVSPSLAGFTLKTGFHGTLHILWSLKGCTRPVAFATGSTYKFPTAWNAALVVGTLPSGWTATLPLVTHSVTEGGSPNVGGSFEMRGDVVVNVDSTAGAGSLPFDILVGEDALLSRNGAFNTPFMVREVTYTIAVRLA
jgi:hypothetical protein